jgi:hypothetical protein
MVQFCNTSYEAAEVESLIRKEQLQASARAIVSGAQTLIEAANALLRDPNNESKRAQFEKQQAELSGMV